MALTSIFNLLPLDKELLHPGDTLLPVESELANRLGKTDARTNH